MIAFVFGVTSDSTASRSMFHVSGSESAGTVMPPVWYTASAVAMFVDALTMTSSPGASSRRRHRRVERRRPVADRHAVRAADVVGERALERRDRLAEGAGDLAAPEGRDDGRDLVFAVDRLEYWNHAFAPGLVGCPG